MEAFVTRKRQRDDEGTLFRVPTQESDEEESTDLKLALLASLHPTVEDAVLLEALLASDGLVDSASALLTNTSISPRKKSAASAIGYQSSLSSYRLSPPTSGPAKKKLVKKGQTLHLYSPADIEAHTPCSIMHNFLPVEQADALLRQLLDECVTYKSIEFKLFDRVVESPHTFAFYVNSLAEAEEQKTEYLYDGRKVNVSIH